MNPDSTMLDRMAQLSGRYARYGHSLPGLSLALGGLVMLLLLLAPPLIGNNAQVCWENQRGILALTVSALLVLWILAKEWLRNRVYQSLGISESRSSAAMNAFIRCLTVTLTALTLAYPARWLLAHAAPEPTSIQIYAGLTACWALPWATLRFIRGWQEGLLWFVICFWALALIWVFPLWEGLRQGTDPIASLLLLALPLAYFGGLVVGLVQHFNFLRLIHEIRSDE
ncbi:MAG TPA: hypothetical protein VFF77_03605 [Holophagaceae bacterium]|nr:hypothetical protein [Holophagaceae bacterium]